MPSELVVDPEWLRGELKTAILGRENIRDLPATTQSERDSLLGAFKSWHGRNAVILERAFSPTKWHESSPKNTYIGMTGLQFGLLNKLSSDQVEPLRRAIDEKTRALEDVLSRIDILSPTVTTTPSAADSTLSEVFLVHGRDTGARLAVHRLLEKLVKVPVRVLSEQPARGQTIIEALEGKIRVGAFVVVLMTADDEGRLVGDETLRPRARQNVIFELGLAVGAVGRRNVVVLYEDGVEMPGDFYGVLYYPFEVNGNWPQCLASDLVAAGFDVDAMGLLPS